MKKHLLTILLILATLASNACWYGDKIKPGSDIIMLDIMYPYWPESTYFACWNINMYPIGGYFYGGVACSTPSREQEASYRPGTVWSFWEDKAYEKRQVRNVYINPQVYSRQYVGEGASGSAGGRDVSWIKTQQWYTMTLRVWGTDSLKKESFVGWWMKDKTNGEWHHLGTFRIPCASTGFHSNAGFLEDFNNGGRNYREIVKGEGYCRQGNAWFPCDTLTIDVPKETDLRSERWTVTPQDGGKAVSLKHTVNFALSKNLDDNKRHFIKINQPETPVLDQIDIKNCRAEIFKKHLLLNWELGSHSSPQLGYRIDVFNNPEFSGEAVVSFEESTPQVRVKALELPKTGKYYVRLTVKDIFDQEKAVEITTQSKAPLIQAAKNEKDIIDGLHYKYCEKDRGWNSLEEIDWNTPTRSGVSQGFDISLRGKRDAGFALQYNGLLKVPETGVYTFLLKSCDGSRLTLGGETVIDNDGIHSASEKRVAVMLEKGIVPISLSYFKKKRETEYIALILLWESEKFKFTPISGSSLCMHADKNTPELRLKTEDLQGKILLKAELSEAVCNEVTFFDGDRILGSIKQPPFECSFIPFEGENQIWCRALYNGSLTVDSKKTPLTGRKVMAEDWKYTTIGEEGLPHNFYSKNGEFEITGNGEYHIYKAIKGDFELTGKVLGYKKTSDQVDDGDCIGLMAKQKLAFDCNNDIAVFHTASTNVYSSADNSDLGVSRRSSFTMNSNHYWLKIVRQGNIFTTFSSPDGEKWEIGLQRVANLPEELYVGVTYNSIPGRAPGVFSGTIGQLSLRKVPTPVKTTEAKLPFVSGILGYSLLDSTHTAIRYQKGMSLITRKNGQYSKTKLSLPKGIDKVRSAIKAGEYLIIAATGKGKSALYRSADWGKNWKEIMPVFPISYPDGMSGEILCANYKNPNEIYAGSTAGLYFSQDAGVSWNLQGMKDENILEVTMNPKLNNMLNALSYDVADDCGSIWLSDNAGTKWNKQIEVKGAEFRHLLYDPRGQDCYYISSTKGLYTTYEYARSLNRVMQAVPTEIPFFANDGVMPYRTRHYAIPPQGDVLYMSDNYYLNWKIINKNLTLGKVFDLRINRNNIEELTVYAEKGIFFSPDAGINWTQLTEEQ